ncbi:hypothetical protein LTR47_003647 [Exophiala xenobiotica]|nr:hypothetical protein LTR47_003647 [Exophiala xenobiotica]KAK5241304.1 hypothetical protein LTS06_012148 [Exophiala xenobiotica]KAK5259029.1 hypothetical protein LTR40_006742 [Exophiala xenobiotica]KAK5347832.1 hypothetical protein LTR61_008461 [Exophiala xenobiotica]KAK5369702.1 hypothetical protein LTR11_007034 [Exophiala xenobiotica]
MEPREDQIFDPDGDVVLILGGASVSNASITDDTLPEQNNEAEAPFPCQQHDETESSDTFEAKVSSKHLILASRVFRAMFNGNFREAVELHKQEVSKVPLPDDNPDAMVVLLNIVHGLNKQVPRKIGETLFLDIVTLIDKYEFHEAAYVFTDIWFGDLWKWTEKAPPHLFHWIYICWVLRKGYDFTNLTRTAILESQSGLGQSDAGPCPAFIITKVESQRLALVSACLARLTDTLGRYEIPMQQCRTNKDCDALVLGSLIQKLKPLGLFPVPLPDAPTMSVKELSSFFRGLEIRTLCQAMGMYAAGGSCGRLSKNLQDIAPQIQPELFGLARLGGVCGLGIESFAQTKSPGPP